MIKLVDDGESAARLEFLRAENEKLRAILIAYEQWEARLILDTTCEALNEMSAENYDRMMEIQAMRNEALGRFAK